MNPVLHAGREVLRVVPVDDEDRVLREYQRTIGDAELEPVPIAAPLNDVVEMSEHLQLSADAVLCDHRLVRQPFGAYTGAALAAACNARGLPAVLCTNWDREAMLDIRPQLRWLPAKLRPSQLEPSTLRAALETCLEELVSGPPPERELWQTLVRFGTVDRQRNRADYLIPAWDGEHSFQMRLSELPVALETAVESEFRCLADVNLGAEHPDDVFAVHWREL